MNGVKKRGFFHLSMLVAASLIAFVTQMASTSLYAAAVPKKTETVTVTDMAGRTVKIKTPVERIILVRSRDIYELAVLLGDELPEKLVAWGPDIKTADKDAYLKFTSKYPKLRSLPEVGSIFSDAVNPEQVLSLDPDLVIMDIFMIERGYKSVDKLQQAGLPLLFLDGSGDPLSSPQKSLRVLGKVLGKEKRANEVVNFVDEQIELVVEKLKKIRKPIPKVYIETGDQGPGKFGSTYGGYGTPTKYASWGAVMEQCRVNNIADGIVKNMAPINPEYVITADPDIIFISGADWTAPMSMRLGYLAKEEASRKLLAGFTNRPGWSGLTAVKNKRVYSLFHGFVMHIFDFAGYQGMAKLCYPEEFKDVNPEKNLKEFHDKFLPIEYSGIWTLSIK